MAKEDKPDNGKGGGADKVDLIIVVGGGAEVTVKAKLDDSLLDVAEKALKKSENTGQPVENWELRTESGSILDLNRTVGSYNLMNGALLSLTLKAGAAG